jgi:hypothetical protein
MQNSIQAWDNKKNYSNAAENGKIVEMNNEFL